MKIFLRSRSESKSNTHIKRKVVCTRECTDDLCEKNLVLMKLLDFKGGLFHGDDEMSQVAFKYAIERINSMSGYYKLRPRMFNISRIDSFKAQKIGKISSYGKFIIY